MTLVEPLEGIGLEGTSVIRAAVTRPELHILARDSLIVREASSAEPGEIVVVTVEGDVADLKRFEVGQPERVFGVVVGLVRRFA